MINPVQQASNPPLSAVSPVTTTYSNVTTVALQDISQHPSARVLLYEDLSPLDLQLEEIYSNTIAEFQNAYFSCADDERSSLLSARLEKTNDWDMEDVSITARDVIAEGNVLIGILLFINDQLLAPNKIPPAPRLVRVNDKGNVTINGKHLKEFLAPTDDEILAQQLEEFELKEPFKK